MKTTRSGMSDRRAGKPLLAAVAKLALGLAVANDDAFRNDASTLGLSELHEGKTALWPFQVDLGISRGGIPGRDHGIEPILVVDAIPFANAPGAVALLEQVIEPRMGRVVEQAGADELADQNHHIGFEHRARPGNVAAHVTEPMLAVLLRPAP